MNAENTIKQEAQENPIESGPREEIEQRADSLKGFLKKVIGSSDFDPIDDLLVKGENDFVMKKIKSGEAIISSAMVSRDENGQIREIHVVFDPSGQGDEISVYLKGAALEKYLSKPEKE